MPHNGIYVKEYIVRPDFARLLNSDYIQENDTLVRQPKITAS